MRRNIIISGILLSSFLFTAAANASTPSDDASAPTAQVSTGITPPQMLNVFTLPVPDPITGRLIPLDSFASVSFTVDEVGKPRDIQFVKGIDPMWNARIASAILNLRYRPATMDDRPVAMGVNLNINLVQ